MYNHIRCICTVLATPVCFCAACLASFKGDFKGVRARIARLCSYLPFCQLVTKEAYDFDLGCWHVRCLHLVHSEFPRRCLILQSAVWSVKSSLSQMLCLPLCNCCSTSHSLYAFICLYMLYMPLHAFICLYMPLYNCCSTSHSLYARLHLLARRASTNFSREYVHSLAHRTSTHVSWEGAFLCFLRGLSPISVVWWQQVVSRPRLMPIS